MSWGLCVGVLGRFFVAYSLVCGSGIPFDDGHSDARNMLSKQ